MVVDQTAGNAGLYERLVEFRRAPFDAWVSCWKRSNPTAGAGLTYLVGLPLPGRKLEKPGIVRAPANGGSAHSRYARRDLRSKVNMTRRQA